MRASVHACVRARVRACVRVCVSACVCGRACVCMIVYYLAKRLCNHDNSFPMAYMYVLTAV